MAAVIEAAQELYRKKKQRRSQATQSNPFENVASNSSNLLLPEPLGDGDSGGTIVVSVTLQLQCLVVGTKYRPRLRSNQLQVLRPLVAWILLMMAHPFPPQHVGLAVRTAECQRDFEINSRNLKQLYPLL
jgi:hypothetical protein